MKNIRWMIIMFAVAGLLLSACTPKAVTAEKISPSKLEPVEGTDFQRVILTEKAAERLGIQTIEVRGSVVPYAAVIYDIEGNTWVYTNPERLTYVRQSIVVDRIEGDKAFLSQALKEGTVVVTVGVSELYGTETGVSK